MPKARLQARAKVLKDIMKVFHHLSLNAEDPIGSSYVFYTLPDMKVYVNTREVAHVVLGHSKDPGLEGNVMIVDGDYFLWGLVHGS